MVALITGQITQVSPRVKRLLAPNPGPFTGPGTNTYIVGKSELVLIDPGPEIVSHIDTLVDELAGNIRWILVTHTHRDHSPAAALLKKRLGSSVEVLGMLSAHDGPSFDQDFISDRPFGHGDSIKTEEFTLTAIHTPGHASNHLCYFLEEEALLFSGDHLMDGSTVVIAPPDGHIASYIDSLSLLFDYPIDVIAPAHGGLISRAHEEIEKTIRHRLKREENVRAALLLDSSRSISDLTPFVYDDVPVFMHLIAQQSLLAHLIKLEEDGEASEQQGQWTLLK
ncbi:MAG: MBL fold metallo-hydrolase [Pseudomonadales bacterium]|nr:MBL fold metallo-hydrolase [Pseudomonadales bacterium]